MSKVFLDTNVLVYALDRNDRTRRSTSRSLLRDLRKSRIGVISTQVLQEFFVVTTRKLSLDPLNVKSLMHWLEKHFEIVAVTAPVIREAIDCSVVNKLSFWDALIVVSAERAMAATLYTEDMTHGQVIRGVRVTNPYRA